jgi:hypothetical protein
MVTVKAMSVVCSATTQLDDARTVKLDVLAEVGRPEINPDELIVKPAGKVPEIILNVMGDCPPEVVT